MAPSPDSDFQPGLHPCDNKLSDNITRVQKDCENSLTDNSMYRNSISTVRSTSQLTSQAVGWSEAVVTQTAARRLLMLPQSISLNGQQAGRLLPSPGDGPTKTLPSAQTDAQQRSIYASYRFKPKSPLHAYLQNRTSKKKDIYTLAEILTDMKEIIKADQMYDPQNPSVVLCSKELEEALNMKGFHLTEFRELILRHLVFLEEGPEMKPGSNETPLAPKNCSPESKPSEATSQDGATSSTMHSRVKSATVQVSDIMKSRPDPKIYSDKSARFKLKNKFRECLLTLSDFDATRTLFSYEEVTAYLSKYILSKKNSLFDIRNIKLAIVKGDPLGEAFGVHAFHRCQVTSLLRNQIIHVEPKDYNGTLSPPRNESTVEVSVPPFPAITKAISMPAGSTLADTLVRKRSSSGDSTESLTVSKKSRRNVESESDVPTEPEPVSGSESESETYEVEYDVDSGEEEKRPPQAGGGSGSSTEDSDVDDNVISLEVEEKEDRENWADSETEAGVQEIPDKINKDDDLECFRCKGLRDAYVKYCSSCWDARKNWTADRPKTKNRKKRKIRDNQRLMARLSNEDETDGSQDSQTVEGSQDLLSVEGSQETLKNDSELSSQESENLDRPAMCSSTSVCSAGGSTQSLDSGFSEPIMKRVGIDRSMSLVEAGNKVFGACSAPVANLCMFCYQRPKNASLIHGRLGHQVCCYPCAKKLWKKQVRCPVCRRKIEKIVKIIMA